MIYLDTHIVVWLYAGLTSKLSQLAHDLLNENEIFISPVVRLELQYLFEIQRVTLPADGIVSDLSNRIGLQICQKAFNSIVHQAVTFNWTRDPFDRLIVANAGLDNDILLSKDGHILTHYAHARWQAT